MPNHYTLIGSKIIGIISAAVGVVIAAALGLYGFSGFSPQVTNNIPLPSGISTPPMEEVDTNASPDESVVNALIVEEGLDRDTAIVISQIDTQIRTYSANYLNYEQTISDQAWDVEIRAFPDQTYIPTEPELESAAITGREIYNASYSFEEIDGVPQFTLRYFVPYEAMSEELKTTIRSNSGSSSAAMIGFLPSAQASGGATGAVFETIIKGLVKEGARKLVGDNVVAAIEILMAKNKLSNFNSYTSALDQLRVCAENPTNPLTKKTYQENPAEKTKVIDQIDEADSQVKQLTAARMLNLAAKTGSKFIGVNLAGKLFFDSVAKWSDETLKEVTERYIDDAKKAVVDCEPAITGLNGSIQYTASRFSKSEDYNPDCAAFENACYENREQHSGSGTFFVTIRSSMINGNGTGTYEQTRTQVVTHRPSHPLTEYNGEYNYVISGVGLVTVEGSVHLRTLSVNVAGMMTEEGTSTNYVVKEGASKASADTHSRTIETSAGFVCYFEGVDFVNGGKYEQEISWGEDDGGMCKMELLPG